MERVDPGDYLRLEGLRASGAVYGPGKLKALWSIGSTFERCSFDGLRIEDAHFASGPAASRYIDCTFDNAVLKAPALGRARFERCSFRDVRLRGWHAAADFIDCVFSGRADSCVFNGTEEDPETGVPIRSVEFRGNDFSRMELRDVVFRGRIDLRLQRLPNGPDDVLIEDAAETLDRARRTLSELGDHDRREDVLLDLDLLQREVDVHHQRHLYTRASDLERDPVTRQILIDALRASADSG